MDSLINLNRILHTNLHGSTIERKGAINKLKVLKTVYEYPLLPIGDIARKVELSFPTLNNLMLDLIDAQLISQGEKGESLGGRKPSTYKLNNNFYNVLCVEVERFAVRCVVLENNGDTVYDSKTYEYSIGTKADDTIELISIIERYLHESSIDSKTISAIGVLMPGLVDYQKGSNQTFYVGKDFNIRSAIEEHFGKFTTVLNDVKATALSELTYGAGKGRKNVLSILMDWGVGLGIMTDGRVYMGNNGFSGEMGHIVFEEDGQLCYCGKRGCLETVASGLALVTKARSDIKSGVPTLLNRIDNIENLSPQYIIKVANEGDQYAIDLISELGRNLGKAISFLIQILNPELIVLSGKFAAADELITIPIQQSINTYTMKSISQHCEVVVSSLGENGKAKGIAHYTIMHFFDQILEEDRSVLSNRITRKRNKIIA